MKTWPEVMEILEKDFPGEARRSSRDGAMQYMKAEGQVKVSNEQPRRKQRGISKG